MLEENHALQKELGADVALQTPQQLQARFPWLSTVGVALGSLGLSGEGWFDGYALLQAFRRKAIAQGARYLAAEAVGAELAGGAVQAVRLADGTRLACDATVCAGGPWAAKVAGFFGVDLPVRARRRCTFVVECPEPLPGCPLLIDTSGFWMRPEGNSFLTGISPGEENDPDDLPLEVAHGELEEIVWPALAARIPAFERMRNTGSWAGYYEFNTLDHNGIVGTVPTVEGLYLANGFSGHGIQQSPEVGRGLAELILHGTYRSLDLGALSFERVLANRPLLERAVV